MNSGTGEQIIPEILEIDRFLCAIAFFFKLYFLLSLIKEGSTPLKF